MDLIIKYLALAPTIKTNHYGGPIVYEPHKAYDKNNKPSDFKYFLDDRIEFGDCDNEWNAYEYIEIGTCNEGYYKYHSVPAGYSEYTYDPETTLYIYPKHSLDQFVKLALTGDERAAILSIIKGKL